MSSATAASMRPVLELFDKRYRKANFFSLNICGAAFPKVAGNHACHNDASCGRKRKTRSSAMQSHLSATAMTVASFSHTSKTPKQCRERWREHLDPNVSKASGQRRKGTSCAATRKNTEGNGHHREGAAGEITECRQEQGRLLHTFHVASTKTSSPTWRCRWQRNAQSAETRT